MPRRSHDHDPAPEHSTSGEQQRESEYASLEIEFHELSDCGLRDHNEDFIGHSLPSDAEQSRQRGWLFALADGVGGHEAGEVASRMAVELLLNGFESTRPGEPLSDALPRLIQRANLSVYEAAMAGRPAARSMATTMVACALRYDRAVVAHVGDSRCYMIRQGYAVPITKDHTMSQDQLRMGLLTAKEAATAAHATVLSRSVGTEMIVNVDLQEHQVFAGDVLLTCSDGLHNSVENEDLARIVHKGAALETAASELIELAKQRDGRDNISLQLIRVKSVERVGMYRGRHYKLR